VAIQHRGRVVVASLGLLCFGNDETVAAVDVAGGAAALVAELAGAWAGEVEHDGERTPIALELEPGDDGKLLLKATVPAAHLSRAALGRVTPQLEGDEVKLGQAGYPLGHRAGVVALDRASGRARWRFDAPAAEKGAFGFPGSPAAGGGFVFVSGLDGRVYAFAL
jgi:hypothetical protein